LSSLDKLETSYQIRNAQDDKLGLKSLSSLSNKGENMSQKMIVTDKTILIDFRLVFKAIREEKGEWEKVEQELEANWESMKEEE